MSLWNWPRADLGYDKPLRLPKGRPCIWRAFGGARLTKGRPWVWRAVFFSFGEARFTKGGPWTWRAFGGARLTKGGPWVWQACGAMTREAIVLGLVNAHQGQTLGLASLGKIDIRKLKNWWEIGCSELNTISLCYPRCASLKPLKLKPWFFSFGTKNLTNNKITTPGLIVGQLRYNFRWVAFHILRIALPSSSCSL